MEISLNDKFKESTGHKEFVNQMRIDHKADVFQAPTLKKGYEVLKQRVANGESVEDIYNKEIRK